MIIKSLSRKSNPGQLIKYATRYLLKEGKNKEAQEQVAILVKHKLRSNSVEGHIEEFKHNESFRIYRRKDSVVLFHTILSLSPGDKPYVSRKILKDLAQKFIELRAPNCLNLAVSHLEKKHAHVHVLTSGVQVNGRSSRVSKQVFNHILKELENYQQEKYPQLLNSRNTHSLTKINGREELMNHFKASRKLNKLHLHKTIGELFSGSNSIDDFKKMLSAKGYELYYRNGRLQGIEAKGIKYRLSSLGYSPEDLKAKTQTMEIEVQTRPGKLPEKEKTQQMDEAMENTAEKELESIQSIRRKSKERDAMERESEQRSIRSALVVPATAITQDLGT